MLRAMNQPSHTCRRSRRNTTGARPPAPAKSPRGSRRGRSSSRLLELALEYDKLADGTESATRPSRIYPTSDYSPALEVRSFSARSAPYRRFSRRFSSKASHLLVALWFFPKS